MRILKPLPGILPMPGHPLADAVGLWPFNSLGNKVFDLSGNGIVLVFNNSPIWVPGENGPAILFNDASNQYLEVDKTVLKSWPFTIICRFKADADHSGGLVYIGDKDSPSDRVFLAILETTRVIRLQTNNAVKNNSTDTTTSYTVGKWHTVVAQANLDGHAEIWLDGGGYNSDSGENLTPTLAWDRTSIGHLGDSTPSTPFSGQIGWVMAWNRILSASERAELYREPFCMFPENIMPEFGIVA